MRGAIALLIALAVSSTAAAYEPKTTEGDGLGLSLALPVGGGVIGPRVDYFLQIRGTLYRVVASAAAGGPLCVDRHCHLSAVFGLMGSWGHKHRVWVELNVGTQSGVGLRFYGSYTIAESRPLWGPAVLVGYEYMAFSGFFFRVGAGLGYVWEPAILPADERLVIAMNLAHVGFKVW